jgi:bifunctional DNA primase/polymerase-like protein/primase-like protein
MSAPRNAMLAAALSYAKRGLFVFPAKFAGKQKLGHTSAEKSNGNPWGYTKDPDEIRAYWQRWPHAAIGLPTGAVNGLLVLDIDTKAGGHEHDGRETLRALEIKHGTLPHTRRASTATGGMHILMRPPPGVAIPNSAGKLGPGIDVRADGGFIIAPPSIRPGRGAYAWINHVRIADAPSWLVDLLTKDQKPPVALPSSECIEAMLQVSGRGVSLDPHDNISYAPMSADDLELEIRVALSVVPSDEYDLWWRIGAAIFDGLGDSGYALFDEWSRESFKYGSRACERKWRDCTKIRSIRVDTVFWNADQHDRGWRTLYKRLLRGEVAA